MKLALLALLALAAPSFAQTSEELMALADKYSVEGSTHAALALYEKAHVLAPIHEKNTHLGKLAWAAYSAGDKKKAKRYARRALAQGHPDKAVREANNKLAREVLGLIALDKGDMKGAEKHLAKAPDSPELKRRLEEAKKK